MVLNLGQYCYGATPKNPIKISRPYIVQIKYSFRIYRQSQFRLFLRTACNFADGWQVGDPEANFNSRYHFEVKG